MEAGWGGVCKRWWGGGGIGVVMVVWWWWWVGVYVEVVVERVSMCVPYKIRHHRLTNLFLILGHIVSDAFLQKFQNHRHEFLKKRRIGW